MNTLKIIFSVCLLFLSYNVQSQTAVMSSDFSLKWGAGWKVAGYTASSFAWSRVGTKGSGNPLFVVSDIEPTDLAQKILKFQCRINSLEALHGLEIRLSNNEKFENYYAITIPIYEVKTFNIIQSGEWHNFSFGLGNAIKVGKPKAENIRYVGIYIQDTGKAPLIFDFSDINIVPAIHTAVLSYTFDDGYDDNLIAAAIMKKHGQTGTAYVIPKAVAKPNYMTLNDLKELTKEGWGISAHHTIPFTEFDAIELIEELKNIYKFFRENDLELGMKHIAYPLGLQNRSYITPIVRSMYDTARIAGGGMETLPPGDYALLRTYNVLNTTTVDQIRKQVVKAKANNQWLILMFHYLHEGEGESDSKLSFPKERFEQVAKIIADEGIAVAPVHKVFNRLKGIVRD
jgi:peptidoglycan/xylan/chitin deacetylase (PgdA/CDA1 family)